MRKNLLFSLLVFIAHVSYGQFVGKKVSSYTCFDGWTINVGDIIIMGTGSLPNKNFAHVYTSPLSLAGQRPLLGAYSRQKLEVIDIRKPNKGIAQVIIQCANGKYLIEIDAAIADGEVISPKKEIQTTNQLNSVDDNYIIIQLSRYKKLLDDGAITEQDYEVVKQKMLDKK